MRFIPMTTISRTSFTVPTSCGTGCGSQRSTPSRSPIADPTARDDWTSCAIQRRPVNRPASSRSTISGITGLPGL